MSPPPISSGARISRNLEGTVNTLSLRPATLDHVEQDQQAEALEAAAEQGAPLCEEWARQAAARDAASGETEGAPAPAPISPQATQVAPAPPQTRPAPEPATFDHVEQDQQAEALEQAAKQGAPLCEEWARKAAARDAASGATEVVSAPAATVSPQATPVAPPEAQAPDIKAAAAPAQTPPAAEPATSERVEQDQQAEALERAAEQGTPLCEEWGKQAAARGAGSGETEGAPAPAATVRAQATPVVPPEARAPDSMAAAAPAPTSPAVEPATFDHVEHEQQAEALEQAAAEGVSFCEEWGKQTAARGAGPGETEVAPESSR